MSLKNDLLKGVTAVDAPVHIVSLMVCFLSAYYEYWTNAEPEKSLHRERKIAYGNALQIYRASDEVNDHIDRFVLKIHGLKEASE